MHIEDICIDDNYRGNNYGKILMNYLIDEAKKEKEKHERDGSPLKRVEESKTGLLTE
jgi:ribosomal protein S18 acetylase RimI-like enzyme